jgi:flagellar hook-length control protein FliK
VNYMDMMIPMPAASPVPARPAEQKSTAAVKNSTINFSDILCVATQSSPNSQNAEKATNTNADVLQDTVSTMWMGLFPLYNPPVQTAPSNTEAAFVNSETSSSNCVAQFPNPITDLTAATQLMNVVPTTTELSAEGNSASKTQNHVALDTKNGMVVNAIDTPLKFDINQKIIPEMKPLSPQLAINQTTDRDNISPPSPVLELHSSLQPVPVGDKTIQDKTPIIPQTANPELQQKPASTAVASAVAEPLRSIDPADASKPIQPSSVLNKQEALPAITTLSAQTSTQDGHRDWETQQFEQPSAQVQLLDNRINIEHSHDSPPFHTMIETLRPTDTQKASTSLELPFQSTVDNHEIVSQIVEHAKMVARPQNTEMIIKLKPEHLGELTFKVAVEQGTVSASFHSNNPEVRSIIEASLPQLKQDLSNQGIKLDNVGVFAGMEQFLSGDHRGGQQYQPGEIPVMRKNIDEFSEAMNEAAPLSTSAVSDGIDYRI